MYFWEIYAIKDKLNSVRISKYYWVSQKTRDLEDNSGTFNRLFRNDIESYNTNKHAKK